MHDRLLAAALRVYATAGRRGATTRRIALEAGVNEVTLFRHFGSKETLLRRAVSSGHGSVVVARLPEVSTDPEAELTEWCRLHYQFLVSIRSFIRTSIAEHEECPEGAAEFVKLPIRVANELHAYLLRLRTQGLIGDDWNARAATSLLMGVLFADAMQRDVFPARYPYPPEEGLQQYVTLFLRAVGFPRSSRAAEPAPSLPTKSRTRKNSRVRHA